MTSRKKEPRKGVCQDCLWASGALRKNQCEHEAVWARTRESRCATDTARSDRDLCGPEAKFWESLAHPAKDVANLAKNC